MTRPRYNTFVITEERESFLTEVRCVSELRCNRPYLIARAIVEASKDRTIFSTRVSGVAKSRHWPASSPLAKLTHAEATRQMRTDGSTPTTLTMLLRAQEAPGF
jgi:hypothetical protein